MPLRKNDGVNCVDAFDKIFNDAYANCFNGKSHKHEQHFVRQLISAQTISALNSASAALYDASANVVKFRAVFLHGSPYARFNAGSTDCRRELADAMFVVYVTQPDSNGVHIVSRRSACLLMFKRSNDSVPKAFSYDPGNGQSPTGTDEEQFYLFNQWPKFKLETGRWSLPIDHGNFDVVPTVANSGAVAHDIGKFAVLWDQAKGLNSTWGTKGNEKYWLAGDPVPNAVIAPSTNSLGGLLNNFIDGQQHSGRDFDPCSLNTCGWDSLMRTLLGYPSHGSVVPGVPLASVDGMLKSRGWGSQLRDINPDALGFRTISGAPMGLGLTESCDAILATFAQHSRELILAGKWPPNNFHIPMFPYVVDRLADVVPPIDASLRFDDHAPFPVLIATVTGFRPNAQEGDVIPLTLGKRLQAFDFAFNRAWELHDALRG